MQRFDFLSSPMLDLDFATNPLLFHEFFFPKIRQSSVGEKVQLAYDFIRWNDMLPRPAPLPSKSLSLASESRVRGNDAFRRRDYVEAVKLYSRSVAMAPADSEQLTLAYSNRSAALLLSLKYELSLVDVNRALKLRCSEGLRQKLENRKEKCKSEIRQCRELGSLLLRVPTYFGNRRDILRNGSLMKKFYDGFDSDTTEIDFDSFARPRTPNFKNKKIPNASNKIKINFAAQNGPHIVAVTDIKPGEIIAVEDPYACFLNPVNAYSHCAHCFIRCSALIPCEGCSSVMYCSSKCRQNAHEQYHRIECQIFSKFGSIPAEMNFSKWTGFRILMIATKQGRELQTMIEHPVYKSPLTKTLRQNANSNDKFISRDYASVHSYGVRPRSEALFDLTSSFPMALFSTVAQWLYLLKQTTFFGEQQDENRNRDAPLTDGELYAAALLLRYLQSDYQNVRDGVDESISDEYNRVIFTLIGLGVYPLMNLFSHSCDPHVRMYWNKNSLVCRAVRPIKAGEEIFDCLCEPYDCSPQLQRIIHLRILYNMKCVCGPCRFGWPTFESLPTNSIVKPNGISKKKFEEYESKYRQFQNAPDAPDPNNLDFYCEYLSVLERRFERPCREFVECQRILHMYFTMESNYYPQLSIKL